MPPFDPSLFIIPITEPKPIINQSPEPEVCLMRIPNPGFDDDSDNDDMMNGLYHFEELDLDDVGFELFDPYKDLNSDGWNEMTDTEEEPESEPEDEEESIPKREVELKPELEPKTEFQPELKTETEPKPQKKDWADDTDSIAMEFLFNPVDLMD